MKFLNQNTRRYNYFRQQQKCSNSRCQPDVVTCSVTASSSAVAFSTDDWLVSSTSISFLAIASRLFCKMRDARHIAAARAGMAGVRFPRGFWPGNSLHWSLSGFLNGIIQCSLSLLQTDICTMTVWRIRCNIHLHNYDSEPKPTNLCLTVHALVCFCVFRLSAKFGCLYESTELCRQTQHILLIHSEVTT